MPVCQNLSGKMLLRHHYIFIITNQCIIIIGKHPLKYSMEINLMFSTSEYLGLVLMSSSHKSSDMTSCLLKVELNTKGYHFWSQQHRQVFISTTAIFDKTIFPYCSKGQEDGPATIPLQKELLATSDNQQEPESYTQDLKPH